MGLIPESEDSLQYRMTSAPVFLPGKFHGEKGLTKYSPLGWKESDITEPPPPHTHT